MFSGDMLVLHDLILSAGFFLTSITGPIIGYTSWTLPPAKIASTSVGKATDALQHGVSQSELKKLFGSESAPILLIEFEAIDPTPLPKAFQDRFHFFPCWLHILKLTKGLYIMPPFWYPISIVSCFAEELVVQK